MKTAFANTVGGGEVGVYVAVGVGVSVGVGVWTGVFVGVGEGVSVAGGNVGLQVFPHRLRHTCATQLLNAGCRITSIQRFLGHKELSSTMIYARAHDQTVADDYFAAMERVEQKLAIVPETKQEENIEVVKVQEQTKVFQLIKRLEMPELCLKERLDIASQLCEVLGKLDEHPPPYMETMRQS